MFKWVIIFSLLGSGTQPPEYYQADSLLNFETEQECQTNLSLGIQAIQDEAYSEEKQAEINHAACFFFSTLGKPGIGS